MYVGNKNAQIRFFTTLLSTSHTKSTRITTKTVKSSLGSRIHLREYSSVQSVHFSKRQRQRGCFKNWLDFFYVKSLIFFFFCKNKIDESDTLII